MYRGPLDGVPAAELGPLAYEFYAPRMQEEVMYAYGWFKPPARPLPEGATALERLIHLVGG